MTVKSTIKNEQMDTGTIQVQIGSGNPLAPAKLLFTVRDCAAMTALSEKTILRLIQRRKLHALSSIRHKRIPASELARFIRDNLN
jgi:excisionase family DNA binding protein